MRDPVSKPSVLLNLIQALCAIILGNVAYFLLAPSLPLPRHRPFQLDVRMVVDFWFCLVAYGLIALPEGGNRGTLTLAEPGFPSYFGNL